MIIDLYLNSSVNLGEQMTLSNGGWVNKVETL